MCPNYENIIKHGHISILSLKLVHEDQSCPTCHAKHKIVAGPKLW